MSTALLLKNLFGTLLLPPANGLLLLALAGCFRRRRWAFGLAAGAALLLFAQSLPLVGYLLIAPLERSVPLFADPAGAGAIVVLGSGLDIDAPEYGNDTANERTLVRIRYGAALARRHHLPVLVTGGRLKAEQRAEGEVMADILRHEFGVSVRWQETESEDTAENAAYSARLLRPAGIRRIVLVTQAFHMRRARLLFERAGFEVVTAPTGFKSGPDMTPTPFDFLPQASALHTSHYALHEWLGLAWAGFGGGAVEVPAGNPPPARAAPG